MSFDMFVLLLLAIVFLVPSIGIYYFIFIKEKLNIAFYSFISLVLLVLCVGNYYTGTLSSAEVLDTFIEVKKLNVFSRNEFMETPTIQVILDDKTYKYCTLSSEDRNKILKSTDDINLLGKGLVAIKTIKIAPNIPFVKEQIKTVYELKEFYY